MASTSPSISPSVSASSSKSPSASPSKSASLSPSLSPSLSAITRENVGVDTRSAMTGVVLSSLHAGESLSAGDCVYMASDGLIYKAVAREINSFVIGIATFTISKFLGFVVKDYVTGSACTVFSTGVIIHYCDSGLVPGAYSYVSDTAGEITDEASSLYLARPITINVSATDMLILGIP